MKSTRYFLVAGLAVLGLTCIAPAARAADAAPTPTATAPAREGPLAERRDIIKDIHEALASLNLTDDQKAQIKDAVQDFRKHMEDFRADHKAELEPLIKDLAAARAAGNEAQMKTDREQIRAILDKGPKPRELLEKLVSTLTPEQRKDFREALRKIRQEAQDEAPATAR